MYTFLAINDAHPEYAMYVATEKSAYCGFYPISDPSEIDGSSITNDKHRDSYAGHVLRLASETYNELMFIFGEMSAEAGEWDEIRSLIAERELMLLQIERIWESVEVYLTHWQTRDTENYGIQFCPCCREWRANVCAGCPISESVGKTLCRGTPYDTLGFMVSQRQPLNTAVIMCHVEDEYRFLVDVAMGISHRYQNEIERGAPKKRH